jgi:predicted MPP superfamily phosphohydrolase
VSSILGFIMVLALWVLYRAFRAALWTTRKVTLPSRAELSSPARRHFLEQTTVAVGAIPFAVCAYGLLYGRLNLEITRKRIKLRRLPKAFDSFRIAQLSDIHIGPFMPAEEIRKFVALANQLKPDLVVLTGDFVTWDASTQGAVVQALAALKAPFGVFGCLGNHEMWTETEDSITRLFAQEGIRILRQQRAVIESGGETLNLIGVDFQTHRRLGRHGEGFVQTYLEGVETLVVPKTANLLLSHNPNSFDRAAQLGIDLTLAGHTHGGQVTLEFVHRNISPSNLITKYVEGWFEKNGAQLYVNRGIGTIAVPIRLNATPEITIFELVREV